jgi:penicillin-binding protein 2
MMRRESKRHRMLTRRTLLLGGIQAAAFGGLAARMYQLQVTEAERYATLADDNRISPRLIAPERGVIVDRYGVPLAANRQTYRIVVVPEQARDLDQILSALNELVTIPDFERQRVLRTARRARPFMPLPVLEDLSWDDIARIMVHAPDLPGVQVDMVPRRVYPEAETVAHVVGYVGAVSEDELTGDPLLGLPGFKIGKAGIEKTREMALRGKAGLSETEVNSVGRVIREIRHTDGQPGRELMLTIDTELQRFAASRFGSETGAAVVMDVTNGEVLALASRPSYDPNPFPRGIGGAQWRRLISDPLAPLTNKAVAGQYAPGSTFKMVTALAAMAAGIKPSQTVSCGGSLVLGGNRFHCWRRGGHGGVNMHEAIVQSCDVYFYEMAGRIGIDRLAEMAHRLGVGVRLGIELPGERDGLMPTQAWKRGATGKPWVKGETLIAGIGQGYVLATPLQLAVMTSRLVNGGRAVKPRLTRAIGSDGRLVPGATAPAPSMGISAEALNVMVRGMIGVMTSPRGTARAARIDTPGMEMGGKTGTAQVRRITMAERRGGVRKNSELERESRDHALFVGFAPTAAPRYAVSVIVEHGGGGSAVAAPIARDILIETQTRDPSRRSPTTLEVSSLAIDQAINRVKL